MSAARGPARPRRQRRGAHAPRAVIDIGSNTVRLVVYEGTARAPETVWNEKVSARLGRDLSRSGTIPAEAEAAALAALARYALIVADLGIADVQTVATAAAREAANGLAFLDRVAALGLEPRLLSGEEEARISAAGAIGAFPGARGVVADLGGGSLELVSIADGESHHATSLPLGTLRLPALRADGGFTDAIHEHLKEVGWASAQPGPIYMIGGTWRAFASYAMKRSKYPLTDPHGYCLPRDEGRALARKLAQAAPDELVTISGISPMRAAYLPDAAALLGCLLDELAPESLVFSSWGLREGLLYHRLDPVQQATDPLLAAVSAFAGPRDASITDAALLAAWSVEIARGGDPRQRNERLRLAAAQLALALHRVEPNLRARHATEWALDKRWIDCDARGRAMICAALFGSLGKTDTPPSLRALADGADLDEAVAWGLGFRLGHRLGAASRVSMTSSTLLRRAERLVLRLDDSRAALGSHPVTPDLAALAGWLGLEPKIEIGEVAVHGDE